MKIEDELLSKRVLVKYNYAATKRNLKNFFEDIKWLEYRLKNWRIPALTRSLELRENQFMPSNVSKEIESTDQKMDLEIAINELKGILEDGINGLLPIEQVVYRATFEKYQNTCQIAIAENTYEEYIKHVKASAIVRLCILLNIAVENNKGNQ